MKVSAEFIGVNYGTLKGETFLGFKKIAVYSLLLILFILSQYLYAGTGQFVISFSIPFKMVVIAKPEATTAATAKLHKGHAVNGSYTTSFCVHEARSGSPFSLAVSGSDITGGLKLTGDKVPDLPYRVNWVTNGKKVPLRSVHDELSPNRNAAFAKSNITKDCNSSDYLAVELSNRGFKALRNKKYNGAAIVVVAAE